MKRRIAVSIALALSVAFVSLMGSDSTAQAQQQMSFRADTGMLTLGPNQVLRLTVTGEAGATVAWTFRRIDYAQNACSGGVCKHSVFSTGDTITVTLIGNEAASVDMTPMPGSSGVRVVMSSNRRNVGVNALIIDATSGQMVFERYIDLD